MNQPKEYIISVIKSKYKEYKYVGMISDLNRRLKYHNTGYNKSTKPYATFDLIYTEQCENGTAVRYDLINSQVRK